MIGESVDVYPSPTAPEDSPQHAPDNLDSTSQHHQLRLEEMLEFAHPLDPSENNANDVAELALCWFDEAMESGEVHQFSKRLWLAACLLIAAKDHCIAVPVGLAGVAAYIQKPEASLVWVYNKLNRVLNAGYHVNVTEYNHASSEKYLQINGHPTNILEEIALKEDLKRCFDERSFWWFSELLARTEHLPGNIRQILPEIASQRPYPGAHAGMWEPWLLSEHHQTPRPFWDQGKHCTPVLS